MARVVQLSQPRSRITAASGMAPAAPIPASSSTLVLSLFRSFPPSLLSSDVALAAKFTSLIIAPSVRGVCVRPSIRGLVWSSVRPSTSLASSILSFLHFPQTGRPRPRAAQASILTCRNFSNNDFALVLIAMLKLTDGIGALGYSYYINQDATSVMKPLFYSVADTSTSSTLQR